VAALGMIAMAGWGAAPALAGWRPSAVTRSSIAYNQGISFDPVRGDFFFDGVSSGTTSGLYRTNSRLGETAANVAVIPATREGYNHAGDLSFDPVGHRVLLPLECYYPGSGGNTCGVGAISVADPATLRFRYYVNLGTAQIQKAMWAEISPDGRWIWTSSATHLLAYRAADVTPTTAARQRTGALGGISGKDLGSVLPTSGVTGAAFYQDAFMRAPRLLIALNQGTYSEVISYATGSARDGSPTLAGSSRSEFTVARSPLTNESEGLAVTGAGLSLNPLGGVLDWQILSALSPTSFYSQILTYLPAPTPPQDSVSVQLGQRPPTALGGLRLTVVCNRPCTSNATATIPGPLARRLGLAAPPATLRSYVVGTGRLPAGNGRRRLKITFRSRARTTLAGLRGVKLTVVARSTDPFSQRSVTYKLTATLNR
jgi:hypothetical protein